MAYTGRPPAAAPLTSGDIPDGSITTADLVDDAVTPAKLSTGSPEWTSGYDFSLYEDTGTTAQFFWDASEERLGIGTSSPTVLDAGATGFHLHGSTRSQIHLTSSTTGSAGTDGMYLMYDGANGYLSMRENQSMIFHTNATERMRIDSSGRVTMPYQPASASTTPNTASGDLTYAGEFFDNGSNFNASTGRFTAPVAGVYCVMFAGFANAGRSNNGDLRVHVNGSNRTRLTYTGEDQTKYEPLTASALVKVGANDYISIYSEVDVHQNSGGTFSVFLVG